MTRDIRSGMSPLTTTVHSRKINSVKKPRQHVYVNTHEVSQRVGRGLDAQSILWLLKARCTSHPIGRNGQRSTRSALREGRAGAAVADRPRLREIKLFPRPGQQHRLCAASG